MKTIVLPTSWCSRMTSFCMSRRISGSSAENGSSNIITSRVGRERPGQPDALLHAAGELVGVGRSRSRTARPGRPSPAPGRGARPCRRRAPPARRRRCRSPGGAAAGRSAGTPSRRGCVAARGSSASAAAVMSSPSIMHGPPAVGSISRVRQPHQRRLAGAGEAHHHEDLAGRDVERDVLDADDAAGLLLQLRAGQVGVRRADDLVGAAGRRSSRGPATDSGTVGRPRPWSAAAIGGGHADLLGLVVARGRRRIERRCRRGSGSNGTSAAAAACCRGSGRRPSRRPSSPGRRCCRW